jgi:hypothetical protein
LFVAVFQWVKALAVVVPFAAHLVAVVTGPFAEQSMTWAPTKIDAVDMTR